MVLTYEKTEKISTITLNRPESMNAIDSELAEKLYEAWMDFAEDPTLVVLVITATGERAFCVGADLKERGRHDSDPHVSEFWRSTLNKMPMRQVDLYKPVIAAIHGYCLGGGLELALACDIRIASEKAVFGLPEIKRGFFPGMGATQRLTRILPYNLAAEMLFTGDSIDSAQALRIGLINRVTLPSELMNVTYSLAEKISRHPPLALKALKEALIRGYELPLAQGLRLEALLRRIVGDTEDAKEGVRAFLEKRSPIYTGK